MRITRNGLAFMSMLTAGVLLAGATLLVPSAKTFGSETDAEQAASIEHNIQQLARQPQPAPASQAPVPPAAPIDSAPASQPDASAPASLPSAGSGGYLDSSESAGLGYLLIGFGAALLGSGSLVWVSSRRGR
jgi:hypothetical protein